MTAPWDTAEDRAFRAVERRNEVKRQQRERTKDAELAGAQSAPRCRCETPQTYRDEDGELRCLCGRGV